MAIVSRRKRNGSISYQVKVLDPNGNWYPTATFPFIDQAQKKEAELNALKRQGKVWCTREAKVVTASEFYSIWRIENRSNVSDGWRLSQDQMWKTYCEPVLGSLTMLEIGPPEIGRVLNRAKEGWAGHPAIGDQTRKHIYSLLRKVFGDAVEYYEMLAKNPVQPRFHRPTVVETQRAFLPPAQAWKLLETASEHSYMGPPVWSQVLAGLRPEAMLALQWPDILWELNQLLIRRAWKNKVGRMEDFPKGKAWEYVPLTPALRAFLLQHWDQLKRPKQGFVCRGPSGGMLPYETYLHALRRLCRSAGVAVMSPHELRHTCTEIYVQAGASAEDIRRLLNQTSLAATKRYIHRTDERLNSIAQAIEVPVPTFFGREGVPQNGFPQTFPNGKIVTNRDAQEEVNVVH